MKLYFHKYHGTGNDFILIDSRQAEIQLSKADVAALCHRRFGIGADGLMLLEHSPDADFKMVYYNSDGGESSMCGNGGRCIVAFAHKLGIVGNQTSFLAIDGLHHAGIEHDGTVSLGMKDVSGIQHEEGYALLDTGSPHYVQWVDDVMPINVFSMGRSIRNEERFLPGGINVNFAHRATEYGLNVRTYERGVEDETLSCGTGVTAAAIAASGDATGRYTFQVYTPGGKLEVQFSKDSPHAARSIILRGPAVAVYEGTTEL